MCFDMSSYGQAIGPPLCYTLVDSFDNFDHIGDYEVPELVKQSILPFSIMV